MPRLKLLLVASGGGHLRQLLDLKAFWKEHDVCFATEDTPLGRDLADKWPVEFLEHFAFGQAKINSRRTLVRAGVANLRQSWRIIRTVQPDVVISTGSGSAFFCFALGRLSGARTVLIESFARFRAPSLFGRLTYPFASRVVAQSELIRKAWRRAEICDPVEIVESPHHEKQHEAVVMVGTVLPFDRLVIGVADLKSRGLLPEDVLAQVGRGGAIATQLNCVEWLSFEELKSALDRADIAFSHGGTGSMITALQAGCRLIVMPRDPKRREHYDDHQSEIVGAFAERGLIHAAYEIDDLPAALAQARSAPVQVIQMNHNKLIGLLQDWFPIP
jgi:UDP-N-acetylglucosamine--N-acetylmuramyl-(pentapeptide) pyrophosphoryl-undecaprenol N-acetylglucosamine transferase